MQQGSIVTLSNGLNVRPIAVRPDGAAILCVYIGDWRPDGRAPEVVWSWVPIGDIKGEDNVAKTLES